MTRPSKRSAEVLVLDLRGSELGVELINALAASLGGTVRDVTDTTGTQNASGAADPTPEIHDPSPSGNHAPQQPSEIPDPGPLGPNAALLLPPAVRMGLEEVVAFRVLCGRCGEGGYAEDTRDLGEMGWTASVGTNFDGVLDSEVVALCPKCSLGFENWMLAVD